MSRRCSSPCTSLPMIVACFLSALARRHFWDSSLSIARRCWQRGRILADRDLRFCPFAVERFFGSRSRCTCSSFSGAKWNASSAGARSSFSTCCSSWCRRCSWRFGGLWNATGTGWLRHAAFRHLHRLRRDLSQRRTAPADSGEMGRADSGRPLAPWQCSPTTTGRSMVVLWISIATACLFVRLRGVGPELVWWSDLKSRWQPKPKFQVVPRAAPRRAAEPENIHESIDPVLEKISKQGINSLTASERRALDRAGARSSGAEIASSRIRSRRREITLDVYSTVASQAYTSTRPGALRHGVVRRTPPQSSPPEALLVSPYPSPREPPRRRRPGNRSPSVLGRRKGKSNAPALSPGRSECPAALRPIPRAMRSTRSVRACGKATPSPVFVELLPSRSMTASANL